MRGQTHSQNSMTGEVAFGLVEWLREVFAFRNSTQFSEGRVKKTTTTTTKSDLLKHGGGDAGLLGAAVTCVPCVVAG